MFITTLNKDKLKEVNDEFCNNELESIEFYALEIDPGVWVQLRLVKTGATQPTLRTVAQLYPGKLTTEQIEDIGYDTDVYTWVGYMLE